MSCRLASQAQYEYKVLPFTPDLFKQNWLDEMGRTGWLLVATCPMVVFVRCIGEGIVAPAPVRPASKLLKINEAAAVLGVSRTTIYQLTRAEGLGVVRIGRAVRIPRDSLEEFVRRLQ